MHCYTRLVQIAGALPCRAGAKIKEGVLAGKTIERVENGALRQLHKGTEPGGLGAQVDWIRRVGQ
eukprot:scaffold20149_cov13-Tisochrysis_lutea.AAC.1